MADMTCNCPRLKRAVCRQAGPWRRKMSATSSTMSSATGPLVGTQVLEWADDLAQQIGGDLGIERCRLQLLVPEQYLNDADIDLLFEQVGGEAVSQRMHGHVLLNLGILGSGMDGAIELP